MALETCGFTILNLPAVYCSGIEYNPGAIVSFRLFAQNSKDDINSCDSPRLGVTKTAMRRNKTVEFDLIGGDAFRLGAKDLYGDPSWHVKSVCNKYNRRLTRAE